MSRQIIVGVDPYRRDVDSVAVGALLGRATGASLRVVGIYSDQVTSHSLNPAERERMARERVIEGISAILEELGADGAEVQGVRYQVEAIGSSSAAHGLQEVARRDDAGLLVVGSTHRGAIGRIVPGSITERVVHGAPCPVTVAPRGFARADRELRRIGVAYAGTREGRLALESAVGLAAHTKAHLTAYTIVDPIAYPGVPPVEASADEIQRRAQSAESTLRRRLEEHAQGVDAEAVVITEGGIDELVARTADLDVLIAGSRGYGPLSAVLLGGVTHALMGKAACPLLLIPRGVENAFGPVIAEEAVAR